MGEKKIQPSGLSLHLLPPPALLLSPFLVSLMSEYPLIPNPAINFRFVRPVRSCVVFSHQRARSHTVIFFPHPQPITIRACLAPRPQTHIISALQLLFTVNKTTPPERAAAPALPPQSRISEPFPYFNTDMIYIFFYFLASFLA